MFQIIKLLLFLVVPFTKEDITGCAYGGYNQPDGHCFVDAYLTTFQEALTLCNSYSGKLWIVHNSTEMKKVESSFSKIALSSQFNVTEYFWLDWEDGTWLDGSDFNASMYEGNDVPEYLVLSWPSKQCIEPISPKSSALCQYAADSVCTDYIYIKTKMCYFMYGWGIKYDRAVSLCNTFEKRLASIHSASENEFIYSAALLNSWGLPKKYTWIGYEPGNGTWSDGTPYSYTNYVTNFNYSRLYDKEYCLVMKISGKEAGQWDAINCTDNNQSVICKSGIGW